MNYVSGFVAAVPKANKAQYLEVAKTMARVFKRLGATRIVETWEDDVPDGTVTDFRRAVQAKADEAIVFSWIEYPSKAVADAAHENMMQDEEMQAMGPNMPFDGKRMIFGGFQSILDE